MARMIIKTTGQEEPFNKKKFSISLKKAGASQQTIDKLADEVEKRTDLKTTQEIYRFAMQQLKKEQRPVAARYNLKKALMDLGPTGFPFEQFVGQLLKQENYQVDVGTFVDGFCVSHEIDVVANKENKHFMIECKFHNRAGLKTDVVIALYVRARFEDVRRKWEQEHGQEFHQAWIVTNTQFTSQAITYGACVDIKLIGWGYPKDDNIAKRIEKSGMYPITCLTTLSIKQKKALIAKDFVLCRDVRKHTQHLKELGLSDQRIQQVIDESEGLCALE